MSRVDHERGEVVEQEIVEYSLPDAVLEPRESKMIVSARVSPGNRVYPVGLVLCEESSQLTTDHLRQSGEVALEPNPAVGCGAGVTLAARALDDSHLPSFDAANFAATLVGWPTESQL